MDTLPLELKEKIVGYLEKADVRRLSTVSKEWNQLLEDIIWNDPEFATKVPLSELVQYNRPIKILYSRSLSDFDKGLILRFHSPIFTGPIIGPVRYWAGPNGNSIDPGR